ncbi:MFS transporter [Micromonospora sp. NPDC005215]|uniref:MFS transporter n=1 Tax=Micromonospora sp. NPDC005215 TaxID=3157024 RepID=UPI0033AB7D51
MITDVAPQRSDTRPWLAFAVVLTAAFMDLVDGTIVSIALPRIQADLGAGYAAAQWILVGYSVTFALVLIPGGRLGDIYGRRRVFLIGIAAFVVASIVCGAATTAPVLVVARLIQGVAAGLMVPQVMSVVVILFQNAERAKAFALYGVTLSLANVSGPLLGALFTEYSVFDLGWRAIFYVNVPIGVLALLGALRWLPESRSETPLRVDVAGIVLISLASFALMFPVIQGREAGWPIGMIVLLVAAAPLLWAFGVVERRRDSRDGSALVPPDLLRQRSFVVGLIVLLVVFSTLASLFLVLNYTLLTGYGWSPIRTALTGIGFPVGIFLTTGVAQRFATTHGRRLIQIGLTVMAIGMVLLILMFTSEGMTVTYWQLAAPILVMGLGMGLCVSIVTTVVLADVAPRNAGAGSGVTNAVLQLGAAVGVAIVGAVFFSLLESRDFPDAAGTALWYNAAVIALAVLLTPFLPAAARAPQEAEAEA